MYEWMDGWMDGEKVQKEKRKSRTKRRRAHDVGSEPAKGQKINKQVTQENALYWSVILNGTIQPHTLGLPHRERERQTDGVFSVHIGSGARSTKLIIGH